MNSLELRNARRYLAQANKEASPVLAEMPRSTWPKLEMTEQPERVLRSRKFLVQQFPHANGATRLSIARTELENTGKWKDGITWDEIQQLKREAGFGERDAVEIFPADSSTVNVANMRHIWILDEAPAWKWNRTRRREKED